MPAALATSCKALFRFLIFVLTLIVRVGRKREENLPVSP
jgi:hypothetical protein